jgi:hypothetical protein
MILTEDNSTEMARADPDNAIQFGQVYFHANECSYYSTSDPAAVVVYCNGLRSKDREGCDYGHQLSEMDRNDSGMYVLPALCPRCYANGTVSGVRTRNENATEVRT